jgi:hypothetical protein
MHRAESAVSVLPVADGLLLVDPATARAYRLNRTASLVFEHCDGARTREELVAIVCLETGARADASALVDIALRDLVRAKLITGPRLGPAVEADRRRLLGTPTVALLPVVAPATCDDGVGAT